jgi:hypothetical protein
MASKAACILAGLLLLPVVAASGPTVVAGDHLDLDGSASLDARLGVWALRTYADDTSLQLGARMVGLSRAEAYDPNLTTEGRMNYPPLDRPVADPLDNVLMTASPWMRGGAFAIMPLEGQADPIISLQLADGTMTTADPDCIDIPGPADIGCWVTQDALRLGPQAAGPVHVTVSGSFFLWLWGWDGFAQHGAGGEGIWSGRDLAEPFMAGSPVVLDRYAVTGFDVSEGILDIALPRGDLGTLIFDDAQVHLDGQAELRDRLGGLVLTTDAPDLKVANHDGRLQLASNSPAGFVQQMAVPTLMWILLGVLGLVGIAAVIIAIAALRKGDPVLSALRSRDHARAANLALQAAPAKNAEESVTRAVAFIHAGYFDIAERELFAYALPEADLKFMLACLRAKQGRDVEARGLLADSVRLQPSYAVEARFNTDLMRATGSEWPPGGYS